MDTKGKESRSSRKRNSIIIQAVQKSYDFCLFVFYCATSAVSDETVAKCFSISNKVVARASAHVCIGTFSLLAQTQAHPP